MICLTCLGVFNQTQTHLTCPKKCRGGSSDLMPVSFLKRLKKELKLKFQGPVVKALTKAMKVKK